MRFLSCGGAAALVMLYAQRGSGRADLRLASWWVQPLSSVHCQRGDSQEA